MDFLSKNLLKQRCKLQQKKYREQQKFVIVEGFRTINHLIQNNIVPEELYIQDEISKFPAKRIYQITEAQLSKLTNSKNPQKIAALVSTESAIRKNTDFLLYLDSIRDPGNLGAIFRTASAAEVSGIVLSPNCCEVFNPKVVRASMGTVFTISHYVRDYHWLEQQNAKILTASLSNSQNIFQIDKISGKIILVLGSEAFGISQQILDLADYSVSIPLSENVESLNVAVAAGILIFQIKRCMNL